MTGFDIYVYGMITFTVLAVIGKLITQPKREKTELEKKIDKFNVGVNKWNVRLYKLLGIVVLIMCSLVIIAMLGDGNSSEVLSIISDNVDKRIK